MRFQLPILYLHKNFRSDVVGGSHGGVGQLPPVLLPALGPPLRVHRAGRKVGELDLRVGQVSVEVGAVRFFESGAETEVRKFYVSVGVELSSI